MLSRFAAKHLYHPNRDPHLHWRAAQVSVATNAPSHRPEAVSLREGDMPIALFIS